MTAHRNLFIALIYSESEKKITIVDHATSYRLKNLNEHGQNKTNLCVCFRSSLILKSLYKLLTFRTEIFGRF